MDSAKRLWENSNWSYAHEWLQEGVMGGMSIFHWLIVIVVLAVYFIPAIKILQKAGYSGWWCLILLVPLVNIIMIYVFAFGDWPALRRG
jgi:uncharacterized membrane protein YhaH (DUF805 family)